MVACAEVFSRRDVIILKLAPAVTGERPVANLEIVLFVLVSAQLVAGGAAG